MIGAVVPVLEVGGTHVTAALVHLGQGTPTDSSGHEQPRRRWDRLHRLPLDSTGSAADLLDQCAAAAARLQLSGPRTWGVAIPGPFDYRRGIGDFTGVDKFAALAGVDVGAGLAERLGGEFRFINDAAAFGLGEATAGAGEGADRVICLTLGTGVGSAFIDRGRLVTSGPGIPHNGWIHTVEVDGRGLEESMSRRALMTADGSGDDVAAIAARAVAGEARATRIFAEAFDALARALAGPAAAFTAERVVIGGSIAGSWSLVRAYLVPAVRRWGCSAELRAALDPEGSPLVGAAVGTLT